MLRLAGAACKPEGQSQRFHCCQCGHRCLRFVPKTTSLLEEQYLVWSGVQASKHDAAESEGQRQTRSHPLRLGLIQRSS